MRARGTVFRMLSLRSLRVHPGRTALCLVGVVLAVMLVTTTLVVGGSVTRSARDFVSATAGDADLEVAAVSPAGFDADLFATVEQIDGVAAAAPTVVSTVVVDNRSVVLVGADARAAAIAGGPTLDAEASRDAAGLDAAVVDKDLARSAGVGLGDTIEVYGGGRAHELTVVGITDEGVAGGSFVGVALATAQEITGKVGRIDAVLVDVEPDADLDEVSRRIDTALDGRAAVAPPTARLEQATAGARAVTDALTVIAALAWFVGIVLVFVTMTAAAANRRRELAIVRSLGVPGRGVASWFVVEAIVVGLAGAVLGAALGIAVARVVVFSLPPFVQSSLGAPVRFSVSFSEPLVGIAVGVIGCALASLPAARRAARVAPIEAIRAGAAPEVSATGPRLILLALAAGALVGGLALARTGEQGWLVPGIGLSVLGVSVALAVAVPLVVRGSARSANRLPGVLRLALAAIEKDPSRVWTTTVAVAMAVMLTMALDGTARNVRSRGGELFESWLDVDLVLQSAAADDIPAAVLMPDDTLEALERLPSVERVEAGQFTFVDIGRSRVLFQGLDPSSRTPALGDVDDEGRAALAGGDAVISRQLALRQGLETGGTFSFDTPGGTRSLRVAEIVETLSWPQGLAIVSLGELRALFGRPGASWFEIYAVRGADPAQLEREVRGVTDTIPFRTYVYTGRELYDETRKAFDQVVSLFAAVQWAVLLGAAAAVLNTMALSVLERRRELGVLRAVGASRRVIGTLIFAEAGVVGLLGGIAGVVFGVPFHRLVVDAARTGQGFPVEYQFEPGSLLVAVGVAIVLALVAGTVAARRAMKVGLLEAMAYE